MHRRPLLALLEEHCARHPEDRARVRDIEAFVHAHADCFERSCRTGHMTASAWIVSEDASRVLLTHHRKLGRWLQLGGHADGDPDLLAVAIREAHEESGLASLSTLRGDGSPILDADIHAIPGHGADPPHRHYDVRFLLVATTGEPLRRSEESIDLRWVSWEELPRLGADRSLRRMAARARERIGLG